jgi:tetratricopeptide (TPR) repeat protein
MDVATALPAYETAITAPGGVDPAALVTARESLARAIANDDAITSEKMTAIASADQKAQVILRSIAVPAEQLALWRGAVAGSPEAWWWSPQSFRRQRDWRALAIQGIVWAVLAIALSSIVETTRRFIAGGDSVFGTVLQGYVGLLIAGSIVNLARDWAGGVAGATEPRVIRRTAVLLTVVLFTAISLAVLRPVAAIWFSNRGADAKDDRQFAAAIGNYRRSLLLAPDNATSHFNLGSVLDEIGNYREAEQQYAESIRFDFDQQQFLPYLRLARLAMLRDKDGAEALRLLDLCEQAFEHARAHAELDADTLTRVRFGIAKTRASANLTLGNTRLAKANLDLAVRLRPTAAAVDCLRTQLLVATNGAPEEILAVAEACAKDGRGNDEVEPAWIAFALDQQKKTMEVSNAR